MTQPARGNPREQRRNPTAQLCVFVSAVVKEAAKTAARGRREKLREFVERALRRELDEPTEPAADTADS